MKAISLLQPWATLVADGKKQFETRSWRTRYRGLLAIHASSRFPRECQNLAASFGYTGPWAQTMPTGAIIAVVRLTDIYPTDGVLRDGVGAMGHVGYMEQQYGDFRPGRWAWRLDVVDRFDRPLPEKGALGLWEWVTAPRCWTTRRGWR